MAFISSDGSVSEKRPWSVASIIAYFIAFIDFILYFFKTLFGMTPEKSSAARGGHVATARYNSNNSNSGSSWYNGGTGGNSGSKPSGGSGNGGVGRNVNSMSSLGVNTNFNGCPGGMCGSGPSI